MKINARCPKCGGTGTVQMGDGYAGVLDALRKCGPKTVRELAFIFPRVRATAMNNRLEYLRAAGLVKREREGIAWIYEAVVVGESCDPNAGKPSYTAEEKGEQ